MTPSEPNPQCAVCSVGFTQLEVDTSRATLGDLVDGFLRLELGYEGDFNVTNDIGTLYDPDLDDNLEKKFAELGITGDSFLTVRDEEEENPRINLNISIKHM